LRVAGRRLDCTHAADGVPLDPVSALAFSCNYYFATMAALLKPEELAMAFERAELGVVRRALNSGQLQLQALGESCIEVTPLGLAQAYRKLAGQLDDMTREGLLGAIAYGTGQLARRGKLEVAGKTGTATSRNGAWTHGWFAGFAPPKDPQFVVVVFLEQGQGGLDAAPIAGTIFAGLS
jgi:cell division protein FtsI/penicillin-binding protein 2